MNIIDLIKNRRSIRRFRQEKLDRDLFVELVETARCAPAGANIQSLEYIIVDEPGVCEKLFDFLAWAGHVKPKRDPAPDQRPVAYIVVISDTEIKKEASVDAAAAIENILLAAASSGVGSCWLGLIKREQIAELLGINEKYKVDSVIALGKPAETPVMEDAKGEDTKYYLDEKDVLHVPKRPLKKILHINKFGS
ncbi:MAG: nitroreductase family protein [Sedimentisphaerales bacterium]|nr:nitroreductase family protein [Sedimentisphaerales bacterium]